MNQIRLPPKLKELISRDYTADAKILSLYVPFIQSSKERIKTKISSAINHAVKNYDDLKDPQDVAQFLSHTILELFDESSRNQITAAFFIPFDPKELAIKNTLWAREHLKLNEFYFNDDSTEVSAFLERTPVIEPWLYARQNSQDSQIIVITKDVAHHIQVIRNRITKTKDFENTYLVTKSHQTMDHFKPLRGTTIHQQSASNKVERADKEAIIRFLHYLKEEITIQENAFLQIFTPSEYVKLVNDELVDELIRKNNQIQYHLSSVLPSTDQVLIDETIKNRKIQTQNVVDSLLIKAQEDKRLVFKLDEIINSINDHNIDAIVFRPSVAFSGYVASPQLVYADKEKNAEKVDNLMPFLINKAVSVGASVYPISPEHSKMNAPIATIRRFIP